MTGSVFLRWKVPGINLILNWNTDEDWFPPGLKCYSTNFFLDRSSVALQWLPLQPKRSLHWFITSLKHYNGRHTFFITFFSLPRWLKRSLHFYWVFISQTFSISLLTNIHWRCGDISLTEVSFSTTTHSVYYLFHLPKFWQPENSLALYWKIPLPSCYFSFSFLKTLTFLRW